MKEIFFNYKYVNRVNLIVIAIYCVVIFFLTINSIKNSNRFSETIRDTEIIVKRDIETKLTFTNEETIQYSFSKSIFNQNKYLDFKKGDNVSYSLLNNAVTSIKNERTNNELNFFYFTTYTNSFLLIIISVFLFYYNGIHFFSLKAFSGVDENDKKDKINEYLKKNKIIALLVVITVVFSLCQLLNFLEYSQYILQYIFFYKYIFIFNMLLLSIPLIIRNFYFLREINKTTN